MLRLYALSPILLLLFLTHLPTTTTTFIDNITYATLHPLLGKQPTLLVITARWCDHSHSLTPELALLATAAQKSPSLLIARADADEAPAIPAAFSAHGYPTILYIPPGHADATKTASEFTGPRWAELIAEFVNNATETPLLTLAPRPAYLRWREKLPYTEASSPGRHAPPPSQYEAPPTSTLGIREPMPISASNFDELVLDDAAMRTIVLFYKDSDPLLRELLLQWRQASSAFTGADNVTVALANLSEERNAALAARIGIADTPRCLYFARCEGEEAVPECKRPVRCDEDMDETENIIQFLSDRVLEEMGIVAEEVKGESYHLSEEEYRKMKEEGAVFANDPEQEEIIRGIYEEKAREGAAASAAERDEL